MVKAGCCRKLGRDSTSQRKRVGIPLLKGVRVHLVLEMEQTVHDSRGTELWGGDVVDTATIHPIHVLRLTLRKKRHSAADRDDHNE